MARLMDYVEIIENNMECVVLKVKPGSRLGMISLGCFDGNEEMIRLTKGATKTCTCFLEGGNNFSWQWGPGGTTPVEWQTERCGEMIQKCLEEDFDICLGGNEKAIKDTLFIRKADDSRGMEQTYILYQDRPSEIQIYKNGCYFRKTYSMENAKKYVYGRLDVDSEHLSDEDPQHRTVTITGRRK